MRKYDTLLTDLQLALALLTRFPLPTLPERALSRQAQAVWAFPVAGAVVALPAVLLALGLFNIGLSAHIAAGAYLLVLTMFTGAMHEDGLADCADGFWGGFAPERRLEIMKDSHIGTYGVLALVFSLGLRWSIYAALLAHGLFWAPIAIAALSRAAMCFLMRLPHARPTGLSASVGTPPPISVLSAMVIACGFGFAFLDLLVLVTIAALLISAIAIAALSKRKIGGQTGDVLGASQQVSEVMIGLSLIALT